jgi:hypothetical protein
VWYEDVEAVSSAALEEANEDFAFGDVLEFHPECGAAQEAGAQPHGDQRECAGFDEGSAFHCRLSPLKFG